jgi:hypothetical protein
MVINLLAYLSFIVGALGLAMVIGGWRWGWIRGPLVVLFGVGAVLCSLITAFFLYAGFTSQGSGTLLLFALPAAVAAWVGFALTRVFWKQVPP